VEDEELATKPGDNRNDDDNARSGEPASRGVLALAPLLVLALLPPQGCRKIRIRFVELHGEFAS
jgi:hypothetical protein